jgi:hypothetical protein
VKYIEKAWREGNLVAVQSFRNEMGWQGRCMTYEALHEQLWDIEIKIDERVERYEKAKREDAGLLVRQIIAEPIDGLEKQADRIKMQIRMLLLELSGKARKDQITEDMISKAKDYPIESLLNVRRKGNILCIVHDEKTPSMSIKNNRVTCFSCGWHGDSIDIAMKLWRCSFQEALRRLQ